jgi:hypothetical protein
LNYFASTEHGGQILILANIVDSLMPTSNMMPRIGTTLFDDYCGTGGMAPDSPMA